MLQRFFYLFLLYITPLCSFQWQCPYGCSDAEENPAIGVLCLDFYNCLNEVKLWGKNSIFVDYGWLDLKWGGIKLSILNYERCETDAFVRYATPEKNVWERLENKPAKRPLPKDQKNKFNFEYYPDFLNAFSFLYDDLKFNYEQSIAYNKYQIHYFEVEIQKLKKDIVALEIDLKKKMGKNAKEELLETLNWRKASVKTYEKKIKKFSENIENIKSAYPKNIIHVEQTEDQINTQYLDIFNWCTENHQWQGALYERGLLNFHQGELQDALKDILKLIDIYQKDNENPLPQDPHFHEGLIKSEMGLYHEAIRALSSVIQTNPQMKEAHLERAFAYFELGEFDLSIQDFLSSGYKSTPIDEKQQQLLDYATGLIGGGLFVGSLQGTAEGIAEIPSSLLSSLRGLSSGLWAFACNPAQVSSEFVSACQACVDYIRSHSTGEIICDLAPELQELLSNFDSLSDFKKGELVGQAIGKHGVELFSGAGALKCMKAYRNLKRANHLLTLETCALSEVNTAKILQEAAKRYDLRGEVLANAKLKIHEGRQGKHIEGHPNFDNQGSKSIFTHSNPQQLLENYAGTGKKVINKIPGKPGYQEMVNFDQIIGSSVNPHTDIMTQTTWGKIHYAKEGAHIVPTYPQELK